MADRRPLVNVSGTVSELPQTDILPGVQTFHGWPFPYEVSLSYDKTARTVTITPTGATFDIWVGGVKYTKTGAVTSTAHANASDQYYLYYNTSGELEWSTTPWDMKVVSPVVEVYYDTIPADGIALNELHTFKRNPEWHESQHFAIGTFVRTGLEISGYTLNAEGNASVTFQVAAGTIVDEDIEFAISTLADNGPYTVVRRSGASGYTWDSANTVPYLSGATWIQYNQNNAGTWQMTEAGAANRWVNYYLYATTALDTAKRLFLVPGQSVFTTLATAQAESNVSLNLTGLGLAEFVCVWKLTFATGNGYTATGRVRLVEVNRITNTRGALSVNLTTTNHSLLTGRDTADSHPASAITNTPAGNISAITVQAAIDELDTEKLPNTTSLTEIGAALVDADEIPVYDTSAAGNRKSLLSRIWTYISGKLASPPAIGGTNPADAKFVNLEYTGTLTGGTGVVNIGTNQIYKDASGNVGFSTIPLDRLHVSFSAAPGGGGRGLRIENSDTSGTSGSPNTASITFGVLSGNIFFETARVTAGTYGNNYLSFDVGGVDRLKLANDGNATLTGNLSVTGNTTLGDALWDTVSLQAGTAALPTLIPAGDTNTGLWFPAADTIAASTAGTERLRIDSSGNVGIGTSSPGVKLDVIGTIRFGTASSAYVAHDGANFQTVSTVGNGLFYIPASSYYRWHIDAAQKMTLDASGNLGIGHTAPNSRLGVFNSEADGAGTLVNAGLLFGRTGWAQAGIWPVGASGYAGSLVFGTAPSSGSPSFTVTERLRIDSSGNLGLGTPTFGTSAAAVLGIKTGTAPTTGPADTIQIYSTDLSAGNTMLSLFTEGTPVNANTTAAATHRIAIRINGTVYYLLANTAA